MVVGRDIELTAAESGLVAQLDWLFESPEINLAQAVGLDLDAVDDDWHRAPVADVLGRIDRQRGE